jgi:phage tail tape-measure protein
MMDCRLPNTHTPDTRVQVCVQDSEEYPRTHSTHPVGDNDGTVEGTALGDTLGWAVGNALGDTLGTAVGTTLGSNEGSALGTIEGTVDGPALGTADGIVDGTTLGTTLGTALGTNDGDAEGVRLGITVGPQLATAHEQKRRDGGYKYCVSQSPDNPPRDVGYVQYVCAVVTPPSPYVKYVNAAGACANMNVLMPWLQNVTAAPGEVFVPTT